MTRMPGAFTSPRRRWLFAFAAATVSGVGAGVAIAPSSAAWPAPPRVRGYVRPILPPGPRGAPTRNRPEERWAVWYSRRAGRRGRRRGARRAAGVPRQRPDEESARWLQTSVPRGAAAGASGAAGAAGAAARAGAAV